MAIKTVRATEARRITHVMPQYSLQLFTIAYD